MLSTHLSAFHTLTHLILQYIVKQLLTQEMLTPQLLLVVLLVAQVLPMGRRASTGGVDKCL